MIISNLIEITFIVVVTFLYEFTFFQNKGKRVYKDENKIEVKLNIGTSKKIIGIISPNDCNTCYSLLINELNNLTLNHKLKNKIIIYINFNNDFKNFKENIILRNRPRFPLLKLDNQNSDIFNLTIKFSTPILLVHKFKNIYTLYQVELSNQKMLFNVIDKLKQNRIN